MDRGRVLIIGGVGIALWTNGLRAETLAQVEKLREIYGLDLTAEDSHRLSEEGA